MSLHDCPGKALHNGAVSSAKYLSPDEYRYCMEVHGGHVPTTPFQCRFPACTCSLSEISGALHGERIDYLVEQKISALVSAGKLDDRRGRPA